MFEEFVVCLFYIVVYEPAVTDINRICHSETWLFLCFI